MRVWSLHPRYLDNKGLSGLWCETLLCQKVLLGQTKGYTKHPQLDRWRACAAPVAAIGAYLRVVHAESVRRGFKFDSSRIAAAAAADALAAPSHAGAGAQQPGAAQPPPLRIEVTAGQLAYEWAHLRRKLAARAPQVLAEHSGVAQPEPHPAFVVVPGPVAGWERTGPGNDADGTGSADASAPAPSANAALAAASASSSLLAAPVMLRGKRKRAAAGLT